MYHFWKNFQLYHLISKLANIFLVMQLILTGLTVNCDSLLNAYSALLFFLTTGWSTCCLL
jgi:hypothetical protein